MRLEGEARPQVGGSFAGNVARRRVVERFRFFSQDLDSVLRFQVLPYLFREAPLDLLAVVEQSPNHRSVAWVRRCAFGAQRVDPGDSVGGTRVAVERGWLSLERLLECFGQLGVIDKSHG